MSDTPNQGRRSSMVSKHRRRVAEETAQFKNKRTRDSHAEAQMARFQRGMTGAGVSLSQPAKPSDPQQSANSASLSERRDTLPGPENSKRGKTSDQSSDAARTGKDADKNRDELVKVAEKGVKNATRDLPKGHE